MFLILLSVYISSIFSLISNEAGRPNEGRPTNGIRIGSFRRAHYILNPVGRVDFHPPLVARSTSGKVLNRTGAEYMFKEMLVATSKWSLAGVTASLMIRLTIGFIDFLRKKTM